MVGGWGQAAGGWGGPVVRVGGGVCGVGRGVQGRGVAALPSSKGGGSAPGHPLRVRTAAPERPASRRELQGEQATRWPPAIAEGHQGPADPLAQPRTRPVAARQLRVTGGGGGPGCRGRPAGAGGACGLEGGGRRSVGAGQGARRLVAGSCCRLQARPGCVYDYACAVFCHGGCGRGLFDSGGSEEWGDQGGERCVQGPAGGERGMEGGAGVLAG